VGRKKGGAKLTLRPTAGNPLWGDRTGRERTGRTAKGQKNTKYEASRGGKDGKGKKAVQLGGREGTSTREKELPSKPKKVGRPWNGGSKKKKK